MRNLIFMALGLLLMLSLTTRVEAQVVYREYLEQNHEGTVDNSVNYKGKTISYELVFDKIRYGDFFQEKEAIERVYYKLVLKVDGKVVKEYPVEIRDLIVSYYFEVFLTKDGEAKTFNLIYNKTNKWAKTKGVLHEGCKNPDHNWSRLNDISSYKQLLDFAISQLDKNVLLECY